MPRNGLQAGARTEQALQARGQGAQLGGAGRSRAVAQLEGGQAQRPGSVEAVDPGLREGAGGRARGGALLPARAAADEREDRHDDEQGDARRDEHHAALRTPGSHGPQRTRRGYDPASTRRQFPLEDPACPRSTSTG